MGEFYEEATRGRSASHHLQVKAALALLYRVLGSPNPFAECLAPKFAPEKTELRYHTSSQLGQLLRELREDKASYFGHLSYHLATALFFTGCRYHEWALLTIDRLVREPGGVIIAARLQVKGGSFRDLPLTTELSDSLKGWFAFLESVKGIRLRTGGIDFAGSALVFPGRDGAPFSNKAFNARLKLACERARVPVISAHPLRHTASSTLLALLAKRLSIFMTDYLSNFSWFSRVISIEGGFPFFRGGKLHCQTKTQIDCFRSFRHKSSCQN